MAELSEEETIDFNQIIGEDEIQYVEMSEAGDLSKCVCTKNPGHTNFIPADKFDFRDLPDGHRDEDLLKIIKAVSDLTVKIEVKMTSSERPAHWPDTDIPYPCSALRGKTTLRLGSGRMRNLCAEKNRGPKGGSNKCWCRKCELSPDSTSSSWWEFFVETAAHVVFNEEEARRTSLILFYNSPDSPVVTIDSVRLYDAHIGRDSCTLLCVTCDLTIKEMLYAASIEFRAIWKSVYRKYSKTREKDKLAFVVSHPHGSYKQITVGHWKNMYKTKVNLKHHKFTCAGSSGGPGLLRRLQRRVVSARTQWDYQ